MHDFDRGVEPRDICAIYYTGTTGLPKGVMHTHFSVLSTGLCSGLMMGAHEDSRFLMPTLISHLAVINVYAMSQTLFGGSWAVATDFSPQSEAGFASRARFIIWREPVPLFVRIMNLPNLREYDFSAVTTVFSGTQIVPDELKKAY